MSKRKHSESCSICMEAVEQPAKLSGCTHVFCKGCILEWSKRENSCPNCRAPFKHIKCGRKKTKVKRARQRPDASEPDSVVVEMTTVTVEFMTNERIRRFLERDVHLGILGALQVADRVRRDLVDLDRATPSGRLLFRDMEVPIRQRLDEALHIWNLRPGARTNPIVV